MGYSMLRSILCNAYLKRVVVLLRLLQMLISLCDGTPVGHYERTLLLVESLIRYVNYLVVLIIIRVQIDSASKVLIIKYVTSTDFSVVSPSATISYSIVVYSCGSGPKTLNVRWTTIRLVTGRNSLNPPKWCSDVLIA